MKGFKLNSEGDVIIENNDIAIVEDNELKTQTVQTVLGTNKGEWALNTNEGIAFSAMLGKGVTEDMALTQLQSGIKQVDRDLYIDSFGYSRDNKTRAVEIAYTARGKNDEVITNTQMWS